MSNSGLIVRRSERFEISLPARVRVGMQHIDLVQFAKGVASSDRWIDVDVVDFAEGGVGFAVDIFFARGLCLELEIPSLDDEHGDPVLNCPLQIQRVQMTDRRPGYLIGCSFSGLNEQSKLAIDALIDRFLGGDDASTEGYHA